MLTDTKEKISCYHCGESCDTSIGFEDKHFCCDGCKMVYQILNKVEMCDYYQLNAAPGVSQKKRISEKKFVLLDDELVKAKLIHFKEGNQSHVTFYLPQMHCSSCIWLLENLHKLDPGVIQSRVEFLKKEVTIIFDHTKTSLRKAAELCNSIGYEPHISLNDLTEKKIKKYDRARIYKIGIAGFCFGNIMLLSFPEYFSSGQIGEETLKKLFSYLNLFLALPVLFYSASEFFVSAYKGLRSRFLNIDAPIALAILITFGRSVYEILTDTGAGYLDSMSGIVFFMLIGRFFQDKTHNTLTFNRDYTSYFPMGVSVMDDTGEKQVPVSELRVGHRIKVHHNEIIPADAILFLGHASIDYSFVTGESIPVKKGIGEIIYAGGRQTGGAIELEVVKEVSQSYLTQLWNNETFITNKTKQKPSFIHSLSRYFTLALFSVAAIAAAFWLYKDSSRVLDVITSVLIVACPCSLLLSATFTNGAVLKTLQSFGFYARNPETLERIASASMIVFDKTGTITSQNKSSVIYEGVPLTEEQQQMVRSLAYQSSHPLSKAILSFLPSGKILQVKQFSEAAGKGISGTIQDTVLKLGSPDFTGFANIEMEGGTSAYIKINEKILGKFKIQVEYRKGLSELIHKLRERYRLSLLSGDNNAEASYLKTFFGEKSEMIFNRKPEEKLEYIRARQMKNERVIMAGDGLNDAGALQQSDVGIAITDNINNFSPACDVILEGKNFFALDRLIKYAGKGKEIIVYSFILSILYNIVGLYFAVSGQLSPVIAAILMPASSISIIFLTTGLSALFSKFLLKGVEKINH